MHEHVKRMTAILRAFQTPTGRTEGSPLRDVTPLTPPEVLHGHADDKLSALQTTRNQEPLHIHPVLTSAAVCCHGKENAHHASLKQPVSFCCAIACFEAAPPIGLWNYMELPNRSWMNTISTFQGEVFGLLKCLNNSQGTGQLGGKFA